MPKTRDETKIDKLVIKVDGKTITLPVEKAKKLFESLKELFEKQIIKEYVAYPFWWFHWPTYRDTTGDPVYPNPLITCDNGSSVQLSTQQHTLTCSL